MSKEKYNQLINEGFCIFENILSDALLDQLRSVTDRLCANMTEGAQKIFSLSRKRVQNLRRSGFRGTDFVATVAWRVEINGVQGSNLYQWVYPQQAAAQSATVLALRLVWLGRSNYL